MCHSPIEQAALLRDLQERVRAAPLRSEGSAFSAAGIVSAWVRRLGMRVLRKRESDAAVAVESAAG